MKQLKGKSKAHDPAGAKQKVFKDGDHKNVISVKFITSLESA